MAELVTRTVINVEPGHPAASGVKVIVSFVAFTADQLIEPATAGVAVNAA